MSSVEGAVVGAAIVGGVAAAAAGAYIYSNQESKSKPRVIVFCGPSGVGKGTMIKQLFENYPSAFGFSVSHTTRKPRPGEQDGVDYYYVTKEVIEEKISKGEMIEHAKVHDNVYGTSIQAVEAVEAKDKICVLDIDVQGAAQVKKSPLLDSFTVFLLPPSMEILEQRLRGRQTETEEQIQKRLKNAVGEIEAFQNDQKLPVGKRVFDIGVVSAQGGVEETALRIAEILKKAGFKL